MEPIERESNGFTVILTEYPTDADWLAVKQRAYMTIGKETEKVPDAKWKGRILGSRETPIRRLRFSFTLKGIPSYVSTHLCRHAIAQPYVRRTVVGKELLYIDNTDMETDLSAMNSPEMAIDRSRVSQMTPVNMIWDMNAETLMHIMNRRLCNNADEVTRKVVEMMKELVIESNPEFEPHLVPMCEYLGRCTAMHSCFE